MMQFRNALAIAAVALSATAVQAQAPQTPTPNAQGAPGTRMDQTKPGGAPAASPGTEGTPRTGAMPSQGGSATGAVSPSARAEGSPGARQQQHGSMRPGNTSPGGAHRETPIVSARPANPDQPKGTKSEGTPPMQKPQ